MLNIPNEIITLCKTDSIRKNFRVHFPNGENADLTNSDIVAGSVQFTESICSKDVLQFGLAESSRIQFECVNVPNIYGMEIECGIEIDTSSLSAGDISSIQNDPGDGVLVLENDSDIGYGYFRIPYGKFTITSCPRSAGAMWKRRVEAYTGNASGKTNIPQFLNYKFNAWHWQNAGVTTMVQNVPLLLANINNSIDRLNTTESTATITTVQNAISPYKWQYQGDNMRLYFDHSYLTCTIGGHTTSLHNDCVYRFTCDYDDTTLIPVFDRMAELGAPLEIVESVRGYLTICLSTNMTTANPSTYTFFPIGNPADTGYFYPYSNDLSGELFMNVGNIDTVKITVNGVLEEYTIGNVITNYEFKKYQITDTTLLGMNINIKSSGNWGSYNTYADSLDTQSLIESYAELNAQFRQEDIYGNAKYITLSKSSPIAVDATEYQSLWWDEFSISPIGSIRLTYQDNDLNQEQTYVYNFGTGLSLYDMTNNYFLKNQAITASDLNGQTLEEYVTGLLDTYFIPNIQDVAFTPVTLEMLGMPFLEAGDYLEIDDGNNGTVGTYIMNHTISGEQLLFDDIESKGGEIIGNTRSV